MESLVTVKNEYIDGLLEDLQPDRTPTIRKKSPIVIKTITKKVPRKIKQEAFTGSDSEGSLAVISLNEDENAEEKLIKNNLTIITNYLNKPEGQTHFITVDMKSVSVPSDTLLENGEVVDPDLSDVYNIRIDEGLEGSSRKPPDVYHNKLEDGNKIKVDKDDPWSRLHFIKFLRKEGEANKKIWQCGICGKEFKHQYTLLRHVTMHTDEKNYQCKDCGKTFRLMSTLSQHKAIHKMVRPYVCGVCRKTFSRVSTLISHKKIHFEAKKHQCSICTKSFHQKGNLKNHFFTHTDERPFRCNTCGKGFNQLSNLTCHKSRAHLKNCSHVITTNNKYKCSCCNLSFHRKAQLYQHEEHSHGIENILSSKKCVRPQQNKPILSKKLLENVRRPPATEEKSGILINRIDTPAMKKCLAEDGVPYALFKPLEGSPVLVKVCLVSQTNHMLVPAVAEELKALGKFTMNPADDGDKSVQIQIPVVAWIIQSISAEGEVRFETTTPTHDDQQIGICDPALSTKIVTKRGPEEFVPSVVSTSIDEDKNQLTQDFVLSPEQQAIVIDTQTSEDELPSYPLIQAEKLMQVECPKEEDLEYSQELNLVPVPLSSQELEIGKDEILDLNDCVQYLRPTGVMGEYEIVDPIAENVSNSVKSITDGSTYLVDSSQFSNLMGVLQLAGYEVNGDDSLPSQFVYNVDSSTK